MYSLFINIYTRLCASCFFFFNDTATTEIYTLSLHDALPIWTYPNSRQRLTSLSSRLLFIQRLRTTNSYERSSGAFNSGSRSEEHTSELQSPDHLVCRLLLEKKKTDSTQPT